MSDFSELWVGDEIWVVSKEKVALFEKALSDQRIEIKIDDVIHLWDKKDLRLEIPEYYYQDQKVEALFYDEPEDNFDLHKAVQFDVRLDLHMEKLHPKQNFNTDRALQFQINAASEHVQTAYKLKKDFVIFVHGKGTGILKHSLQEELITLEEVVKIENAAIGIYGEDAIKVILQK